MKVLSSVFVGLLFLSACMVCFADGPIVQGPHLDWGPAVAYDSKRGEYLVVWSEFLLTPPFFGPVKARRVRGDGTLLGTPITISDTSFALGGVRPSVAYSVQEDMFCIVWEAYLTTWIRFVLGGTNRPNGYTWGLYNTIFPKVYTNSITGEFLVVYEELQESPPGSGQCNRLLRARRTTLDKCIPGLVPVETLSSAPCAEGVPFDAAFCPATSVKFPKGRFLIAIGTPALLKMLDDTGVPVPLLYDPQSGIWYDTVPFQQTKIGELHGFDVAFGYWNGAPYFFLVWGDTDQTVDGSPWSGIMGGLVDAAKEDYLTTDVVTNETFPISWIYEHFKGDAEADSWRPQADYSEPADEFVIVWRETPTTHVWNDTKVNHVRMSTRNAMDAITPPPANTVLSLVSTAPDPTGPALAASSNGPLVLVAWEDKRNIAATDWDIYGTLVNASNRSLMGIKKLAMPWLFLLWE